MREYSMGLHEGDAAALNIGLVGCMMKDQGHCQPGRPKRSAISDYAHGKAHSMLQECRCSPMECAQSAPAFDDALERC